MQSSKLNESKKLSHSSKRSPRSLQSLNRTSLKLVLFKLAILKYTFRKYNSGEICSSEYTGGKCAVFIFRFYEFLFGIILSFIIFVFYVFRGHCFVFWGYWKTVVKIHYFWMILSCRDFKPGFYMIWSKKKYKCKILNLNTTGWENHIKLKRTIFAD